MLKAYIDGACEPVNPGGTGSYGLVIYRNGTQIHRDYSIIGYGDDISNNVAEYAGLLALLEWCIKRHMAEPVLVLSDSALLVNQMAGRWEAKHGRYFPLYQKANAVIDEYGMRSLLRYQWIPREENAEADGLSKEALLRIGVMETYQDRIGSHPASSRAGKHYHRGRRRSLGSLRVGVRK